MTIKINDYVYIPSKGLYGKVRDIFGDIESTEYLVSFICSSYNKELFCTDDLIKLEAPNFKEGDIVTGRKGVNVYGVTTEHAIMEVLRADEKSMEVKLLSHDIALCLSPSSYTVAPIFFELVRPRTNFYRGVKED